MEFSSLASGSSGNCFFVESEGSSVLIDAGISCKQIEERLGLIGKSPEDIKALFITHEHIDHIRGADVFSRKNEVPIYMNKKTFEAAEGYFSDDAMIKKMPTDFEANIRKLSVSSIKKSHDAIDPVSYSIEGKNKKISVLTDIGYSCNNVIKNIKNSDALFLESNHDPRMLEVGPYPPYLKARIKSDLGHLSNYEAALTVLEHAPSKLKNICLSHISLNNNTPKLALSTFLMFLKEREDLKPKLELTYREKPTELFRI